MQDNFLHLCRADLALEHSPGSVAAEEHPATFHALAVLSTSGHYRG